MKLSPTIAARIAGDDRLWQDFTAMCDCGGRFAGTESERRALAYVRAAIADTPGARLSSIPVPYLGWRALRTQLEIGGRVQRCHPLVRSVATRAQGINAEVIDVGRGTPEEFEAHGKEIAGRIVLVRHELMFAAGTIHRRRKYEMARAAGAVGFLIAAPHPGMLVTGSSGRDAGDGIPGLGITLETAALLRRTAAGRPSVRMIIETEEAAATTETLVAEIPGQSDEWVVLSAHIDGHDINESAMDNASGVACALAAWHAVAPEAGSRRRGVRLMIFSVEEWALTGSAQYVQSLANADRARISLNVNLDSVAGSPNLTAMTSGFGALEPFLIAVAEANGQALRTVRPLMMNSDHGNFAQAGIPALRLVAGYDDASANLRYVLTEADTRDKVARAELREAALLAAAFVSAGTAASPETVEGWRESRAG
jgi:hypothetical protein